ncbi:hypothetical protein CC80DRAFT_500199 [Byssothecium circinans]|uniref:RING-type domain-containing protein n=1 Tax=Byssothecium circinans TaxID=147558 RepID=A0A6A5UAB3_9PLEO|nr:hypothetical protein CC80DRAFT_500199 [Byssothecium circinans]
MTTRQAEYVQSHLVPVAKPPSDAVCSICLNKWLSSELSAEEVIKTRCGHMFHKTCLTTWLTSTYLVDDGEWQVEWTHNTCPYCRGVLFHPPEPSAFESDEEEEADEDHDADEEDNHGHRSNDDASDASDNEEPLDELPSWRGSAVDYLLYSSIIAQLEEYVHAAIETFDLAEDLESTNGTRFSKVLGWIFDYAVRGYYDFVWANVGPDHDMNIVRPALEILTSRSLLLVCLRQGIDINPQNFFEMAGQARTSYEERNWTPLERRLLTYGTWRYSLRERMLFPERHRYDTPIDCAVQVRDADGSLRFSENLIPDGAVHYDWPLWLPYRDISCWCAHNRDTVGYFDPDALRPVREHSMELRMDFPVRLFSIELRRSEFSNLVRVMDEDGLEMAVTYTYANALGAPENFFEPRLFD